MTQQIVLATHNPHKVAEFARIVAATRPDLHVIGYDGPEPVEDGVNFAENALIKARAAARHTGLAALADDGANGRAGVGDALPGGLVDPDRGHVLRRPRLGSVVQLVHLTPSFVRLY